MQKPTSPDNADALDVGETGTPVADEGEHLVRKTTHEVEPGDMTAPFAP